MINRFFNKAIISREELQQYKNTLNAYLKIDNDERDKLTTLIDLAVDNHDKFKEKLFKPLTDVIQGQILSDDVTKGFVLDIQDNTALAIMNSKASIFDVSSLNVDLKPTYIGDFEQEQDIREFIKTFNRVLNENYLSKPQYKFAISDAIKYSRGFPMAVTLIGWDDNAMLGNGTNFMGDVTCENIPIDSFYWDPSSNSIDTCEYCFITKTLPYMKVKTFISKLKNKNEEVLEAYYVTTNADDNLTKGTNSIANNQVLINNGAIELLTFYIKENVNDKIKIKVYHVVGKKYIIGKQDYDISYLPFAILKETSAPDSFTGISSVMVALPYLKQKAFLDAVMMTLQLYQKSPQYTVATSSGIDGKQIGELNVTSQGATVHMLNTDNVNNCVSMIPTPVISNEMLALRELLNNDINRLISTTDLSNFGSKLSGSAVQNVLNQATIAENTSITELERYIVRLVSIVLDFLRVKLSQKKTKETLQFRAKTVNDSQDINQNSYEFVDITPDEFENLYADVYIDASLLRTSKQQKQQQDLLQLFQLQAQYFGDRDTITFKDIVNNLNLPNKQAVIERLEKHSEEQKLSNAIQLVNGVLQLTQNPETQDLGLEQATAMVLQQIEQQNRGGS